MIDSISTVSVIPTGVPANYISEQVQLYISGTTYRLYVYDYLNQDWQYATLGNIDLSAYQLVANLSTDVAMGGGSPSNTQYPSQKAVHDFVISEIPTLPQMVASADLLYGTTGTYAKSVATATKLLQVASPYAGTLRVIINCDYGYFSGQGHYQIYKNGSPISGTQNNFTNASYVGSNDITGIAVGDLIQIYVWSDDATKSVTISPITLTYSFSINGKFNWNFNSY